MHAARSEGGLFPVARLRPLQEGGEGGAHGAAPKWLLHAEVVHHALLHLLLSRRKQEASKDCQLKGWGGEREGERLRMGQRRQGKQWTNEKTPGESKNKSKNSCPLEPQKCGFNRHVVNPAKPESIFENNTTQTNYCLNDGMTNESVITRRKTHSLGDAAIGAFPSTYFYSHFQFAHKKKLSGNTENSKKSRNIYIMLEGGRKVGVSIKG